MVKPPYVERSVTADHFPLKPSGYIGEFEIIDDHRAGKIVVNLTGRLNKVSVVLPCRIKLLKKN